MIKMSKRLEARKTRQARIDELFEKYGLFDKDGYLKGPDDPIIKKYEQRLEMLSRKAMLKPEEEREAMELIALDRSYTRELNKYILEQGVAGLDEMSGTSSDDEDFLPEEYESDIDSEEITDDGESDCDDEDDDEDDEEDTDDEE